MADLTTLEAVKRHLALDSSDSDTLLAALVSSSSASIQAALGRPILSTAFTEVRSGDGGTRLLLNEYPPSPDTPPIAVTSVTVDGVPVPARAAVTSADTNPSGWAYQQGGIDLVGYCFTCGTRNVSIVYRVGYLVTGEAATVPATSPYTVQAARFFGGNVAVTTAAGVALTNVTTAPSTGQYNVTSTGLYTFAEADAGVGMLLSYATVPDDLQQAVIEDVALRFRDRRRQGLGSESGAGESVSFSEGPARAYIEGILDHYRAMVA